MVNIIGSILTLIIITAFEWSIYSCFIKKRINIWGASKADESAKMAGYSHDLKIISTRAIVINSSIANTWKWLMQLGADRCGFYSYYFIEKSLGYISVQRETVTANNVDLKVGDTVRGSIDETSCLIPYNFKVAHVQHQESLVLDNWGTFLLQEINHKQTRLLIRTQEHKKLNLLQKVVSRIILPLHFIMERKTLTGLKQRAEVGEGIKLIQYQDIIWFCCVLLSFVISCSLVFVGHDITHYLLIPSLLATAWVFNLLLCKPNYINGLTMLLTSLMFSTFYF